MAARAVAPVDLLLLTVDAGGRVHVAFFERGESCGQVIMWASWAEVLSAVSAAPSVRVLVRPDFRL
jgi:hypothetical protein